MRDGAVFVLGVRCVQLGVRDPYETARRPRGSDSRDLLRSSGTPPRAPHAILPILTPPIRWVARYHVARFAPPMRYVMGKLCHCGPGGIGPKTAQHRRRKNLEKTFGESCGLAQAYSDGGVFTQERNKPHPRIQPGTGLVSYAAILTPA
jgi:hypothetical protein